MAMPEAGLDVIVTSVFIGLLGLFFKSICNKASGMVCLQTCSLTVHLQKKQKVSFEMLMSDICFATILKTLIKSTNDS